MNDTYIVTTYVVIDDILKAWALWMIAERVDMPPRP
jgi:hypothetical protein